MYQAAVLRFSFVAKLSIGAIFLSALMLLPASAMAYDFTVRESTSFSSGVVTLALVSLLLLELFMYFSTRSVLKWKRQRVLADPADPLLSRLGRVYKGFPLQ